jgi:two-component system response regulator AtoC
MKQPGEPPIELPPESAIFGSSEAMKRVRRELAMIASADVPVLIHGPSGTGKEIIARMIHCSSACAKGRYLKINCPAIPDALLESELFGYEKGAFTGAYTSKPGLITLADQGTLFLDEIGELSLPLQSKLLQVLQDGKFSKIGGKEDTRSEARVICATNRDLRREIAAGNFREDLFYRINVVNISMPALRERSVDIPQLVEYFLGHFNLVYNRKAPPLSASLMKLLQAYHWPGNIRQLENLIKRYVILGSEACIAGDLADPVPDAPEVEIPDEGPVLLKKLTREVVRRLERRVILKVLQAQNWNRRRTAEVLKISYRALLYKIRDAGLSQGRLPGLNTQSSAAALDSRVPESDPAQAPASLSANRGSQV